MHLPRILQRIQAYKPSGRAAGLGHACAGRGCAPDESLITEHPHCGGRARWQQHDGLLWRRVARPWTLARLALLARSRACAGVAGRGVGGAYAGAGGRVREGPSEVLQKQSRAGGHPPPSSFRPTPPHAPLTRYQPRQNACGSQEARAV